MLCRNIHKISNNYSINKSITNIRQATFFKERESIFKNFSEEDKINTAIAHSEIEDAEIGFYKGIGFYKLGAGYKADAVEAFNETIRLDSEKIYTEQAKQFLKYLQSGK